MAPALAIIKSVWKRRLDSQDGRENALELSVVREDRKTDIMFSVVEGKGKVKTRLTFILTGAQAHDLARFIGGITEMAKRPESERGEDDLTPTVPGGPEPL